MLKDKYTNLSQEQFEEKVENMLIQKKEILEEFKFNRKRKAFSEFLKSKEIDFVEKYEDLEEGKKTQLIQDYLQEVETYLNAGNQ
jgi:hypothetical protein